MPRATTRKTRPAPSAAPLVTRRRAADLREEKKSKEQVVKAVQEKRAPISEVTKFVPLAPGNKVRVQVGKEKVWVDGVVTKFFGPLPMKLDETQTDLKKAVLLPVRFRLHEQGSRFMQRFRLCDIQLVKKNERDENTKPM